MSFLSYKDINFTINGKELFCNSISLSQDASLERPVQEGEIVSTRNQATAPKRNTLTLNYYLTGKCPLKDRIFTNYKYPFSGRINNNLQFNQGYLESYQLNASPHEPILISVQILVADEISGSLANVTPSAPPENLSLFNYNDSYFSDNTLNITDFSWEFRNEVQPIYYQSETGKNIINPDRIFIGAKEISANFTSDSQDLILGFTGTPINLTLTCKHPSLNITEDYPISGFINNKTFNISTNDIHQTSYSITQSHVNNHPAIASINTSLYPSNNYITITSPNLENGFYSNNYNNLYPVVEKITLGDRNLNFTINRNSSTDTITGIIPVDAINGTLSVATTKGLIVYPTQINLNFSGIGVSGFWPDTGNYHDTILISGSNFHRVTQVLFNNTPANFNVFDTTGFYHKLIASVPDNATVGKINVISSLRNVSGLSTGNFYPIPQITGFTPTGTWSGTCIIAGNNFSGITNVYFNNIKSPSFTVNNNKRITAIIPGTGAGYTKGYIKLSGHGGIEGLSKSIYQPIVRITGMNLISGGIDEDVAISGIFDPDFLYSDNGGYRLSFGNEYSIFYRHDDYTLTGLVPTGFFDSARPALFEPDGVGKYPPFTGNFLQIATPIVYGYVQPPTNDMHIIKRFQKKDIILRGANFNYFFNTPYKVRFSGAVDPVLGEVQDFNNVEVSNDKTILIVKDVRLTGVNSLSHYSGWVSNAAGHSNPFILYMAGIEDFTQLGTANQFANGQQIVFLNGQLAGTEVIHPASYAIDSNETSFSLSAPFGGDAAISSGWFEITFNSPINFGAIKINNQITTFPFDNYPATINGATYYLLGSSDSELANTGSLQCFNEAGASIFLTGVQFTNITTIYNTSDVVSGVKRLKLFRNDSEPRYLRFSDIKIYD